MSQHTSSNATENQISAPVRDPIRFLRARPSLFGGLDRPFAGTLRRGIRSPVSDVEMGVDAEVIPFSEGRPDWELLLAMGQRLDPWPASEMRWTSDRWREVNETTGLKPGDERMAYGAAGAPVSQSQWKEAVDGLWTTS